MKEYLIVGGGIDALMAALRIKMNQTDADITIKTQNSDPRSSQFSNPHGSTWAGLSSRHVTFLEGYNRNLLGVNDFILQNTVSRGGWLGKNLQNFSEEELQWLARRLSAQHFISFNKKLSIFFKEYNKTAISIWHDLMRDKRELFHNVNINYNMRKYDNENIKEFSLSITNLSINILDYLEALGVKINFNTEVSSPADFQNIIIMVGAYGHRILQNTVVKNRLCAVAGNWLAADINSHHGDNFHICEPNLWEQNYTYLFRNRYIVSGGYALVGFDYRDLCPIQKNALVARNIQVAARRCHNIQAIGQVCFRGFTDNDLPLLTCEMQDDNKKIIIAAGMNTGTTTSSPLTGQIISNLLLGRDDPWQQKLDHLNYQWQLLINHHQEIYKQYYCNLAMQCEKVQ